MKRKNLVMEFIKFIFSFGIGWIVFVIIFTVFNPEEQEISDFQSILSGLFSIIITIFFSIITNYNNVFRLREIAKARFSNIDIEKKRSEKLLKQATDTMYKYMEHEKNTHGDVSKKRYGSLEIDNAEKLKKIKNSQEFKGIIENYPDLKSNTGIQQLLNEIVKSEDGVSKFKLSYNDIVAEYNYTICSFPINIVRGFRKLKEMDYYVEPEDEIEIVF